MFEHLLQSIEKKLSEINNTKQLSEIKTEFLGKQSIIHSAMQEFKNLLPEKRKELGQEINSLRTQIQDAILEKQKTIEAAELQLRFSNEKIDLTIPQRTKVKGSIHPITKCLVEIVNIFTNLGFDIKDGPNIETDWYNFTALNMDENHPARQMHDTFYLNQTHVLRTHTSPIQIRTMQNEKPPFRFIAPGRTYRSDSDMTHTPMFHQVEGLVIDETIHMGHMKYTIIEFIKNFFEDSKIEIRFRPSFFPFTEPSAEVDIRLSPKSNWLEVLGAGMVHPNVLKHVNLDSKKFQGFAFGLGVERFAMLKYGIKDLRQFFEGDINWLKHYGTEAFDL